MSAPPNDRRQGDAWVADFEARLGRVERQVAELHALVRAGEPQEERGRLRMLDRILYAPGRLGRVRLMAYVFVLAAAASVVALVVPK